MVIIAKNTSHLTRDQTLCSLSLRERTKERKEKGNEERLLLSLMIDRPREGKHFRLIILLRGEGKKQN
jgi:hypothetical protein